MKEVWWETGVNGCSGKKRIPQERRKKDKRIDTKEERGETEFG